jgi:hypothetical protein
MGAIGFHWPLIFNGIGQLIFNAGSAGLTKLYFVVGDQKSPTKYV